MNIRRAETRDMEKINDLLLQVLTVHYKGRPDLFKPGCRKYNNAQLSEIIYDDNRPVFVYEEDGEVLGYAFCRIREVKDNNIFADMKTLYIDDLCVDEGSRGKHIGSSIYGYVKNYAREIGCYSLTLNVWECNKSAYRFYESMGLTPRSTTMETVL